MLLFKGTKLAVFGFSLREKEAGAAGKYILSTF